MQRLSSALTLVASYRISTLEKVRETDKSALQISAAKCIHRRHENFHYELRSRRFEVSGRQPNYKTGRVGKNSYVDFGMVLLVNVRLNFEELFIYR